MSVHKHGEAQEAESHCGSENLRGASQVLKLTFEVWKAKCNQPRTQREEGEHCSGRREKSWVSAAHG